MIHACGLTFCRSTWKLTNLNWLTMLLLRLQTEEYLSIHRKLQSLLLLQTAFRGVTSSLKNETSLNRTSTSCHM